MDGKMKTTDQFNTNENISKQRNVLGERQGMFPRFKNYNTNK